MKRVWIDLLVALLACALLTVAFGEAPEAPLDIEGGETLEIDGDGVEPAEANADMAVPEEIFGELLDAPEPEAAAVEGPKANAIKGTLIDPERFPDEDFRKALVSRYGDGNGYVDLLNLEELSVPNSGIHSLKGIEYMPNLDTMNCSGNPIQSLDLRDCPKLRLLECCDTDLEVLNVTDCLLLKSVSCSGSKLSKLKVADNGVLERIDISDSQITSLDVHEFSALQSVICRDGKLKNLNVSDCHQLITLILDGSSLTALDVNNCGALEYLHCDNNKLTGLAITGLPALSDLSCKGNPMASLSVSGCRALETLDCSDGRLESLNVTDCPELYTLICENNRLTSLSLSGTTGILDLRCSNNKLPKLPTGSLKGVMELYCANNQLTALNVTKCSSLDTLDCSGNKLAKLDLSGCPELYRADCYNNKLASLNVDGCQKLALLHAHGNALKTLDVGKSNLHGNINADEIGEDSYNGQTVMTYRGDLSVGWSSCEGWMITFDASMTLLDRGNTLYTYVEPTAPITPPPGASTDEPTPTPTPAPKSIAKARVTAADRVYTGKALKPTVKVVLGSKTLKKGTDYTVKYANNRAVGTATVTVTGKGLYTGKAKGTFRINPKAVAELKLTAGSRKLVAAWKKVAGATGYQIQYGTKKDFSGAKKLTVKKAGTVKATLKKLGSKKTYYVRVRAYKKVDGKNYYSAWVSGKKKTK